MGLSPQRWYRIAESRFPWEKEALDYLRAQLPDHAVKTYSLVPCAIRQLAFATDRLELEPSVRVRKPGRIFASNLSSGFEELHRIAVGIFHLNLSAARAHFHLVAKVQARFLQDVNLPR
jgi:hypothetical protein